MIVTYKDGNNNVDDDNFDEKMYALKTQAN